MESLNLPNRSQSNPLSQDEQSKLHKVATMTLGNIRARINKSKRSKQNSKIESNKIIHDIDNDVLEQISRIEQEADLNIQKITEEKEKKISEIVFTQSYLVRKQENILKEGCMDADICISKDNSYLQEWTSFQNSIYLEKVSMNELKILNRMKAKMFGTYAVTDKEEQLQLNRKGRASSTEEIQQKINLKEESKENTDSVQLINTKKQSKRVDLIKEETKNVIDKENDLSLKDQIDGQGMKTKLQHSLDERFGDQSKLERQTRNDYGGIPMAPKGRGRGKSTTNLNRSFAHKDSSLLN